MKFNIAETDIQTTAYAADAWVARDAIAIDSQRAMRDIANILWIQTKMAAGETIDQAAVGNQIASNESK